MIKNEKLIKDENEAIKVIKSNMPTSGYYMLCESLEMAIKALEEIQEYRKLGTVEELRSQKHNLSVAYKIISDYQDIGALEEIKEAVEKTKPKKTEKESCPDFIHYKCPSCGKIQKTKYIDDNSTFGCILNNCSNCGQRLEK